MTSKEYYDKYGYQSSPQNPAQQADWDSLSNTSKEDIKQNRPFYQGPGEQEQGMAQDWWDKVGAGPDTNIWEGMSEMLGIKPGAIKAFAMKKFGELMQTPDFAKEYGIGKQALHQQLMDEERSLAGKFASRGLLDSSAHAQAVGGAMGGYTQGLSSLMLGKAGMQEQARATRFNQGMGMVGQGMKFADFLNTQYLQELGLGAQAISYLAGERGQENQFNMQRYGVNPNPNNPVTGLEGALMIGNTAASMYEATNGFNFNWDDYGGNNDGS